MEQNKGIAIPKLKTGEIGKAGLGIIREPDISEVIQQPEKSEISETIKEWLERISVK